MAAVFSKVAPLIIVAEGGDQKHKNDYGGETKFGISQREYPNLVIADITPDDAVKIIQRDYWDKYRLGEIEPQVIANQTLLLFMNMNPENAVSIVQRAIQVVGGGIVRVTVDGILGSETINAINMLAVGWLSDRIRVEATKYYLKRTDDDETQEGNLRGWIRRTLI